MVDLLRAKGFDDDNIRLLVDDDDSVDSPDHVNVKNALKWLCSSREPEDIIFMHFSGHGTQVPADDDDVEEDNLDEAICLEELFLMADDDLKQFFSLLPEGAHATVVMDCCHSGSMLDGTEVVIEGAKDEYSETPHEESASLLSVLGGSREVVNRSLPISTIAQVMSGKLGTDVPPTGSGINGAMAQVFGGDAGKLMMKFALSQLKKSDDSQSNALVGMLGGLLMKNSSSSGYGQSSGGSSNPLGAIAGSLLGGGGSSGGSGGNNMMGMLGGMLGGSSHSQQSSSQSNPLGMLSGMMGGGGSSPPPPPQESSYSGGDPGSMLSGMLGGLGLSNTTDEAPAFNPSHGGVSRDVCTLITGCQADETSADVRPPGGDAYGALTKTLTGIYENNPDISYYDLVSNVRSELSKGGFKQNPCLETSESTARLPFIC